MVTTTIKFSCGCGFHTAIQSDAESHVEATHHEMTIFGNVKQDRPRPVAQQFIPPFMDKAAELKAAFERGAKH
jgi:hypothetical protein